MKRIFYIFIKVILLLALTPACASALGIHVSPDIKGTIINADTKKPIKDVVVTASWTLIGFMGSGQVTLKVSEALTNEQGEYVLPGWGPKFYLAKYERQQPLIRFFKPGFVPLMINNNTAYHPGLEDDKEHLIKEHIKLSSGRTAYKLYEPEGHQVKFGKKKHAFMLERFEGTSEEYMQLLGGVSNYVGSLNHIINGKKCEWKRLPITFSTLHKLKAEFDELSVMTGDIPYVSDFGGQVRCGNASKYFERYLK